MAAPISIIGIMVNERDEVAPELQEVITKFGRDILGRMGVPSSSKENGLITLIYEGELDQVGTFHRELEQVPGITVQSMSFSGKIK